MQQSQNYYEIKIHSSATNTHLLFEDINGRFKIISPELYNECFNELDEFWLEQAKKEENNYCWPCHEKRDIAFLLREKGHDVYLPDNPNLHYGRKDNNEKDY